MLSLEGLITTAKKIPQVTPSQELGTIFGRISSSHDPIFVYEGDNFIGLISGSYSFFKKRYPRTTKVSSAKINPPKLKRSDSITTAAKHMIATKTYALPIIESEKITGVITARSILKALVDNPDVLKKVAVNLSQDNVVTVLQHSRVGDVYAL